MTLDNIIKLMEKHEANELAFEGGCHNCGMPVNIVITHRFNEGDFEVKGNGAVYGINIDAETFALKCETCYERDKALRNYRDCEVYSRVCGYLRPVKQWNGGKQSEFRDRSKFDSVLKKM
jgi:hypothetical protein